MEDRSGFQESCQSLILFNSAGGLVCGEGESQFLFSITKVPPISSNWQPLKFLKVKGPFFPGVIINEHFPYPVTGKFPWAFSVLGDAQSLTLGSSPSTLKLGTFPISSCAQSLEHPSQDSPLAPFPNWLRWCLGNTFYRSGIGDKGCVSWAPTFWKAQSLY